MKKLEVFIDPFEFDALKGALLGEGVVNIGVSSLRRYGCPPIRKEFYLGEEVIVDYREELKLELVLLEKHVVGVLDVIKAEAPKARIAFFDLADICPICPPATSGKSASKQVPALRIANARTVR